MTEFNPHQLAVEQFETQLSFLVDYLGTNLVDAVAIMDRNMARFAEARKERNKRGIALEKAWQEVRDVLEPKLLDEILQYGDETRSRNYALETTYGSAYTKDVRETEVKIVDEKAAMEWLLQMIDEEFDIEHSGGTHEDVAVLEGWVEMVPKLTKKGRDFLRERAAKVFDEHGELLPFASVRSAGKRVIMRAVGEPKNDPKLMEFTKRVRGALTSAEIGEVGDE